MEFDKFINPYHFLPLDSEVPRKNVFKKKEEQKENRELLYTGEIQVELKTRTPLFIPDCHGAENKEGQHKTYKFFTYDGVNPVIPGSSIRGMLRSMYEPLTNSCLSAVNLDEQIYRRSAEQFEPGLLKRNTNGKLFLCKADKYVVPCAMKNDSFTEGSKVLIKPEAKPDPKTKRTFVKELKEWEKPLNKDWKEGYYFQGEPGVKKTGESANAYVFVYKGTSGKGNYDENSPELLGLKKILDSYKEQAQKDAKSSKIAEQRKDDPHKGYKTYAEELDNFLKGKGNEFFPVHYSIIEKKKVYLSPACITKEAYHNSVGDILRNQGNHQPCTDVRKLCPACSLFGMAGGSLDESYAEEDGVPDKYPNSWAGSVRIQDAGTEDKDWDYGEVTLLELASPKINMAEFYLEKPTDTKGREVLSWTYDYYIASNGTTAKAALHTPSISGRKCYWHHKKPNFPDAVVRQERNETVHPLKAGKRFAFSVYFEQISKLQLDQLIWLCNISQQSENGQAKYGYKLGTGKPLGMGSIELLAKEVKIRNLRNKEGKIGFYTETYKETFREEFQMLKYEDVGFTEQAKAAFLRMCDFNAAGDVPVLYPVAEDQKESFAWFGYNHFRADGTQGMLSGREDLRIGYILNPLDEKSDITLPVLSKSSELTVEKPE